MLWTDKDWEKTAGGKRQRLNWTPVTIETLRGRRGGTGLIGAGKALRGIFLGIKRRHRLKITGHLLTGRALLEEV